MSNKTQIEIFFGGVNYHRKTASWAIWPGRTTISTSYVGQLAFLSYEDAHEDALKRCWPEGETNKDGSLHPDVFSYMVEEKALADAGVDLEKFRITGTMTITVAARAAFRQGKIKFFETFNANA